MAGLRELVELSFCLLPTAYRFLLVDLSARDLYDWLRHRKLRWGRVQSSQSRS
jgi:hypothetical protein